MTEMPDFTERYRGLRDSAVPIDSALDSIVSDGADFIDCIKAVREAESMSLARAKSLVHSSGPWRASAADREQWWKKLKDSTSEASVNEAESTDSKP